MVDTQVTISFVVQDQSAVDIVAIAKVLDLKCESDLPRESAGKSSATPSTGEQRIQHSYRAADLSRASASRLRMRSPITFSSQLFCGRTLVDGCSYRSDLSDRREAEANSLAARFIDAVAPS